MIRREASSRVRVVLALDAGECDRPALEIAANLAAKLDAELTGIFLEDARILEALALPRTRVQSIHSASGSWAPAEMLRALRIYGDRLRAELAAAAERAQAEWSFQILRGEAARVLPEVWQDGDLLALSSRNLLRELATPLALRTGYSIHIGRPSEVRRIHLFCEADETLRATLERLGFLRKSPDAT